MSDIHWNPDPSQLSATHIAQEMQRLGVSTYKDYWKWSVDDREGFWKRYLELAGIQFRTAPERIFNLSADGQTRGYLPGARLNIVESCFSAPLHQVAVYFQKEGGPLQTWSYQELRDLASQVSNGLAALGLKAGDPVAVDLPMTAESIAIYLGIVQAGCSVVSIADSFAPDEIKTRLRISGAKAIFTQDCILRSGKILPLYEKVQKAEAPQAIVLCAKGDLTLPLRSGDLAWESFLKNTEKQFAPIACDPEATTTILFSSGTTGDPKAIPWSQSTPLKCGMDGYFHHDIHPEDRVAWPTNLGWMMGPWLIYAALLNRASIALYEGAPSGRDFGEFIQNAKVTVFGLVPSLVKAWRASKCMEGLDWSNLKCFSSTGECSNASDYSYLMSLAGNRPVVEYCGGTEIGGGYLTQTLLQEAHPAIFSTLSLGLDAVILDEVGQPSDEGELYLIPPSIGLSTKLLNRDHNEVYFADTPRGVHGEQLRRHGDQVQRLPNGNFRAQGRADDTMNLGGIKVSSAELERVLNGVAPILETAAIAVPPPGGGPSLLVVYAVLKQDAPPTDQTALMQSMQVAIRNQLNPLFKIHEVLVVAQLPRTASNKVMRRVLRTEYLKGN